MSPVDDSDYFLRGKHRRFCTAQDPKVEHSQSRVHAGLWSWPMEKAKKEPGTERTEGDWKGQTGENVGVSEPHSSADSCCTSYTEWTARAAHTMSRVPAGPQEARKPCAEER